MTELRPLLAAVGLFVVAVAIVIWIARLRGWRLEWWDRFLSSGRTRGRRSGAGDGPASGSGRGGRPGSAGFASPAPAGTPGSGSAETRGRAPERSGTESGRQTLIDLGDLPLFNPGGRPRAATLDREFDVGDLGALDSGAGAEAPPAPRPRTAGARGEVRPAGSAPPRRSAREEPRPSRSPNPRATPVTADSEPPPPAGGDGELRVVLTIVAADERDLAGSAIRDALAAFDLQPDDLGMFHHYGNRRGTMRSPVFSVANVLEPGVFDLDAMDELATPGLCLFMHRPGPLPASVAFDLMLDVGTRLSRALSATLCDDQRCRLTVQATRALRERVVHFALRHERGAPNAG